MKITLIRHGDPDYAHDSLTEKGFKQAEALAEVLLKRRYDEIYVSPLGRAKKTAEPYLSKAKREAITLPWLQEAPWCWDFAPQEWTGNPQCYDPEKWLDAPEVMLKEEMKDTFRSIESSFYEFMERHGYQKKDGYFKTDGSKNEVSVLFFCHLGLGSYLLSRLTNMSPMPLWHNVFLPTSSITLIQSEERIGGHASFRIRELGATPHLENDHSLFSEAGAFRESAKSEGQSEIYIKRG